MSDPAVIEVVAPEPPAVIEVIAAAPAVVEIVERGGPSGPQGPQGEPGEPGPPGGAFISGWWDYSIAQTPPPASGEIRTTPDAVVGAPLTVYLSAVDDDGLVWQAGTVVPGNQLRLRGTAGAVQLLEVVSTTPGAGFAVIETTVLSVSAQIAKQARVEVTLIREPAAGPPGPQGPPGPAGADGMDGTDGAPGEWVQLTQAAYDALAPPDPGTLYVIVG